ncbi:MDR family MFS transporter [Clostridium saccharobutylicum]|uniref:MFS-type transporter YhcA n=1 Tax=Clostridium saccharobutylicum DSM 13864 TaxID=1345695 RepID=U5MTI9_CLOSA|nr:MDR family MFS transporter [Clostridium saccharobutylicum]AGX42772.1 MFS-type transporter YhcA [Clostridium saccharobutylicum DSM 13864]AQR90068.1 multidrug export protein EmrB [Clostridium saccharobutylicum]AQR99973.1 multidrug export protein EmrB [Clostridium saccharobutylicum]AQS09758.1 multidrug export protein EmrB [Clostridium saccharobutylicum]AQS13957.1 multidrug export protein EmrB [Clostridium saccharobutylicum]
MKNTQEENEPFWSVMFAIFLGVFLGTFNMSAVNIALPMFMKSFNTNLDSVKWILTGFMLATGTACPLAGYLGEKFSYKKLYLFALSGFTIASALCAFSLNIAMLVTFRVIQGIFSGLIIPSTMTIIYQVISRKRHAFAISLWSMASMLAPALGPTLSGWLLQYYSWKSIFVVNIPIGLIGIVLVIRFIPQYNLSKVKSFDFIGFAAVIILSLSTLVAFSEGSVWGWSSFKTISLIIISIASLGIFIKRELKVNSPALNIRVFKFTKYSISIVAVSIVTIALYAGTLLTPLFLQNSQQLSTLETGIILLPPSLAMALMMPMVGTLYNRIDPRILIITGICFIALGSYKMSNLTLMTSHSYIIFWMTIRYIGISFSTMPITNSGMVIIPKELSGHASSINNWLRQVSSSLAIGIFSSLLVTRTEYHANLFDSSNISYNLIQQKSYTMGINDIYLLSTIIVLIGLPLSFMLKKHVGFKETQANDITSMAN